MEFGAHLPIIGFDDARWSLQGLVQYTETAERLGYTVLAQNDHLLFPRAWLDGPTALAAVLARTGRMALMTTLALPVLRGPVALAKTLAAIDLLSNGRLIVATGPGSSARDYAAVGIPFEERWKRHDESVRMLRSLWNQDGAPFKGTFYSSEGMKLEPYPAQQPSPPIWIGSWGSEAGLRRTARLGDGWLASAYNTTPQVFGQAWNGLKEHLRDVGKNPLQFPNALSTAFFYVTEDKAAAERVVRDVVSPTINRPEAELRERLLIGSAHECAEKAAAYQAAGLQRLLLWPVADDLEQLAIFQDRVIPLLKG